MKTIKLDHIDNYRIIAISDVHGHKYHLEELIKKVQLKTSDILIILGDFINRGINSLETYTYIRQLSKRKNTYILKGNHEYFIHAFLEDEERINDLHSFLKKDYYETIVGSLLEASNHSIHDIETDHLLSYFKDHEVLDYLSALPILLEIDDHIFVHGGYDKAFTHEGQFLKYDHYNDKSAVNDKHIIVGHWPACNLRYHELSNMPFINSEKRITSIDGGMGVKRTGELNAYIIEKTEGILTYKVEQFNDFREAVIVKTHVFESEPLIHVNYPYYEFEFLEKKESMSVCRHVKSQLIFTVFNCLLDNTDGRYKLKTDYINKFLNLDVGETVLICEIYEACVLVKHKGVFGWILREQLLI